MAFVDGGEEMGDGVATCPFHVTPCGPVISRAKRDQRFRESSTSDDNSASTPTLPEGPRGSGHSESPVLRFVKAEEVKLHSRVPKSTIAS